MHNFFDHVLKYFPVRRKNLPSHVSKTEKGRTKEKNNCETPRGGVIRIVAAASEANENMKIQFCSLHQLTVRE